MIQLLFSCSLLLSASLLFVIQPLAAKVLLPIYGGTPAVWTVCMLFFQSVLLLAYGYAWILSRFTNPWFWRCVHGLLVLVSIYTLPPSVTPSFAINSPDLAILQYLIIQFGLPLLVIGASAPLLQFAYSQTQSKQANDPYFLYVTSNAGSLLVLLAYPWLIEHYIGLKLQFYYWKLAYVIYFLFLLLVLFTIPNRRLLVTKIANDKLPWLLRLRWVCYSFIPCSLMIGVSFYISTDIAATPLLWLVPLALYLLSFIITFAQKPYISHAWVKRNILFFIIFPVLGFIVGANVLLTWELIFFHVVSFFMLALLCHGELVRIRPPANQLTFFYFCLALGGALAGVFNGLLAPRVFTGAYEYPLILTLAMLCIPVASTTRSLSSWHLFPLQVWSFVIVFALLLVNYFLPLHSLGQWLKGKHCIEILALCILLVWPKNRINLFMGMAILTIFLFNPWFKPMKLLIQQRNFYGVKEVLALPGAHALLSHNTLHGFQIDGHEQNSSMMAYYGPVSPIVQRLQAAHQSLAITIVGLGTGMMACQFDHDDRLKIIDVDKQIIDIASNPNYFTYLRDCPPAISLLEGDGRLVLADSQDSNLDLLVIDAFTSDAIPTHLLTLEAFKLYQQKIKDDGVILANISNRHLHLLPVLMAAGRELDLIVLHKLQAANYQQGQFPTEWVLLTANRVLALELMRGEGWRFAAGGRGQLWTDDYSNIVPIVKWV